MFAGEDLQSLEHRAGFFVAGVVGVGLLDGLGGESVGVDGFGGAGDHDLQGVEVFPEHGELCTEGVSGFGDEVPHRWLAGFVDFLDGLIHFAQGREFVDFVGAEGTFAFGGFGDVLAGHGAGLPHRAVAAALLDAPHVESVDARVGVAVGAPTFLPPP